MQAPFFAIADYNSLDFNIRKYYKAVSYSLLTAMRLLAMPYEIV